MLVLQNGLGTRSGRGGRGMMFVLRICRRLSAFTTGGGVRFHPARPAAAWSLGGMVLGAVAAEVLMAEGRVKQGELRADEVTERFHV